MTNFIFKGLLLLVTLLLTQGCSGIKAQIIDLPQSENTGQDSGTTTTTSTSTTSTTLPTADGTGGRGGGLGAQTVSCPNGRSVLLYIPTSYNENSPAPLISFFYGLGDDAANFNQNLTFLGWRNLADSQGFIIAVPSSINPNRESFLYFNGNTFDETATTQEVRSNMQCILDTVGAKYNISRLRIHWAGFSEGGSFVNYSASIIPTQLRSVIPYAGGSGRRDGADARKIPLFYISGTADPSTTNIQQIAAQWSQAGHEVNTRWVDGVGHSVIGLMQSVSPSTVWDWIKTR